MMGGSLGEKIGEGAFADVHAWAPGQVLKLFKAGVPRRLGRHEARMTRAVFAAGAPTPEAFDEVNLEGRFGILLHAPRRTDPAAALAERRHNVRADGGDPRDRLHLRSQDAPATGRTLLARLDGRHLAALRRNASEAHRHWYPLPDRAPAAGGRPVPLRPSPRQRDHDGGWSEDHRLGRCRPSSRRPATLGAAT